jgi:uracil-DNA glycosylase family 4
MNINDKIEQISNSGCSKCPDLVAVRKRIVVSRGNPEADTVLVGQNPGAREDENGSPFSGPAGQLLDDIIRSCGYDPNNDFFFTNVVMCHTQNNAEPNRLHVANCSDHFQSVTGQFKKFLAIGRFAAIGIASSYKPDRASSLAMAVGMKDLLTKGAPVQLNNGKMMFVTYHTSYLLRMG